MLPALAQALINVHGVCSQPVIRRVRRVFFGDSGTREPLDSIHRRVLSRLCSTARASIAPNKMATKQLIFQLGTNNWQRQGEFAPGSGILHEAHHQSLWSLPNTKSFSVYPSKKQRFEEGSEEWDQVRAASLVQKLNVGEGGGWGRGVE